MQQTRRRQSMDYSPAASTNHKRLDPFHHHRLPSIGRSTSSQSEQVLEEEDPGCSSRASGYSLGKRSSDMLLMAAFIGAGERHRGSSFGSCPTWNTFDKCPATPSPICSPFTSLSCGSHPSQLLSTDDDDPSFATPNQSSCVISNGVGKDEATSDEMQLESRKVASTSTHHRANHSSLMRDGDASSKKSNAVTPQHGLKGIRCVRPVARRNIMYESDDAPSTLYADDADADDADADDDDDDDDDGRLPAVSEEQELDRGCNRSCCLTMSSHISSGSDSECGSGYANSDMQSYVEERMTSSVHQGWVRRSSTNIAVETRRNKLEEKLTAWKEARTMKLMDKLRRKEAAIDKWERKKIDEAKNDMRRTEAKLEKTWSWALNRMQRAVRSVQKEAERKKAKTREAAAKRIAKVTEAFEKTAVTGKLPGCFVFFSN